MSNPFPEHYRQHDLWNRANVADSHVRSRTIYETLKAKLGREPTRQEQVAEVRRILQEVTVSLAEQGKLKHQRKRA